MNPRGMVRVNDSHSLRYTFNALVELEEICGENVSDFLEKLNSKPSMKSLRAVVWAGMLHENGDATQADAGNLIDEVGFNETMGAVTAALEAAFPKPEKSAAKKQMARSIG